MVARPAKNLMNWCYTILLEAVEKTCLAKQQPLQQVHRRLLSTSPFSKQTSKQRKGANREVVMLCLRPSPQYCNLPPPSFHCPILPMANREVGFRSRRCLPAMSGSPRTVLSGSCHAPSSAYTQPSPDFFHDGSVLTYRFLC